MIYKVFWPPFEHPLARRVAQLFYFLAAAPWFIGWWGLARYLRMLYFFAFRGETFELDYRSILSSVGAVKGVLHVGASTGQEAATYEELAVPRVLWIEAQEECRAELEEALKQHKRGHDKIAITAVSCEEGEATLYRTDNSISSSLKPLGRGHHEYFPFIRLAEAQQVRTETLDGLLRRLDMDFGLFDFLYLDVQGAELDVLKGSTAVLPHIRHIMTEISSEEHYQGGVLEAELHAFLESAGFTRIHRQMPPIGHGNAFYARRGNGGRPGGA